MATPATVRREFDRLLSVHVWWSAEAGIYRSVKAELSGQALERVRADVVSAAIVILEGDGHALGEVHPRAIEFAEIGPKPRECRAAVLRAWNDSGVRKAVGLPSAVE